MRGSRWAYWAILLMAGLVLVASCSEKSVTPRPTEGPVTRLTVAPLCRSVFVCDSTNVYVTARSSAAITRVEIWAREETKASPDTVAFLTTPVDTTVAPDSVRQQLRPLQGYQMYKARWLTKFIKNGTGVDVFSIAYDANGKSARSDVYAVSILNLGVPLTPPRAQLVIVPDRGTTETVFTFDASGTQDDVNRPDQIIVRWDFNGDGIWDHDWDENLPATFKPTFKYNRTGTFTAVVEAKNTYLPGQFGRATRSVEVTTAGGFALRPPEPRNYGVVLAGDYHVGQQDTTNHSINRNEFPLHVVHLTSAIYVEKTEVTNRLYLAFVKASMQDIPPRVRYENRLIMYYPDRVPPVESDSLPQVALDPSKSAIFWDQEGDTAAVSPANRDLPVVGVSWYGAKAYAERYGLRLPTEHEWEIGARADSIRWGYPWGTTITPDRANYLDSGFGTVRERGSYPNWASPFGLLDMSGNAAEWVNDWYGEYPSGAQTNPEGPASGTLRVIRGGSFLATDQGVRVTARDAADPTVTSVQVGFRTAFTDTLH